MIRAALIVGICAISLPATAQRAGVYVVEGLNQTTIGTYQGIVTVTPNGAGWEMVWEIGTETRRGVGLIMDGLFVVGYVVGSQPGVIAYRLRSDGSLAGSWTSEGVSGRERLVPR